MQVITNEEIAQAVIETLSDRYARKILFATTAVPKSAEEVSSETSIPISTCYRRIHSMVKGGILVVDRIILTEDGRKFEVYKSAIKDARVNMDSGKVTVEATINTDGVGRLYTNWMKIKEGATTPSFEPVNVSPKNDDGLVSLDLDQLIPKSLASILRDCDVCHDQYVMCHTFVQKHVGTEKFVCLSCEKKIPMKKEVAFKTPR